MATENKDDENVLMKVASNELGVALVLEIILVAAVLAAAGFTVYKVHAGKSARATFSSPAAISSSPTVDSACMAAYHDNDLCRFASNSKDLSKQSYQATITSTQGGQTSTITFKNDGKSNTSLSSNLNGTISNSIELSGATYIQDGDSWIKYSNGPTTPTVSNPSSGMNIGVDATGITYKKIGPAACGNLSCLEFQISSITNPGTSQYAWFDTSSYQLHEWKSADSLGNVVDMKINYQAITISAPSPVKAIGQ